MLALLSAQSLAKLGAQHWEGSSDPVNISVRWGSGCGSERGSHWAKVTLSGRRIPDPVHPPPTEKFIVTRCLYPGGVEGGLPLIPTRALPCPWGPFQPCPTPSTSVPLGSVPAFSFQSPACLLHPAEASSLLRLGLASCGLGAQLFSLNPLPFSKGRPHPSLVKPLSTSSEFPPPCQGPWPSS